MSVASLEKKLSNLKKCQKKMAPGGSRSAEVSECVIKVVDAIEDYIKSDNVDAWQVAKPLIHRIEEAEDFCSAAQSIKRAISNTEAELEQERADQKEKGGWF